MYEYNVFQLSAAISQIISQGTGEFQAPKAAAPRIGACCDSRSPRTTRLFPVVKWRFSNAAVLPTAGQPWCPVACGRGVVRMPTWPTPRKAPARDALVGEHSPEIQIDSEGATFAIISSELRNLRQLSPDAPAQIIFCLHCQIFPGDFP